MPAKAPVHDILTVSEVAALLRVRPETIYNWAKRKRIPYMRFGGVLRFDRSDIEAWKKARKVS